MYMHVRPDLLKNEIAATLKEIKQKAEDIDLWNTWRVWENLENNIMSMLIDLCRNMYNCTGSANKNGPVLKRYYIMFYLRPCDKKKNLNVR